MTGRPRRPACSWPTATPAGWPTRSTRPSPRWCAGNSLGSGGGVGISLVKDGTVGFDKAKFLAAYAADPAAVAGLFQEGGTATDSHVSYLAASDNTRAGDLRRGHHAGRRPGDEVTGAALSGAGLVAAETIEVRVGGASGTTVSYAAAAGESLASVADGLNAAFAQQSLALSASVVGRPVGPAVERLRQPGEVRRALQRPRGGRRPDRPGGRHRRVGAPRRGRRRRHDQRGHRHRQRPGARSPRPPTRPSAGWR